jgi:mRNA-degrading endonuclease RelE of RelBE toxin-antitoxin system
MGFYSIAFKKSAEKELRSLEKKIISRVLSSIEELTNNPIPPGSRK